MRANMTSGGIEWWLHERHGKEEFDESESGRKSGNRELRGLRAGESVKRTLMEKEVEGGCVDHAFPGDMLRLRRRKSHGSLPLKDVTKWGIISAFWLSVPGTSNIGALLSENHLTLDRITIDDRNSVVIFSRF